MIFKWKCGTKMKNGIVIAILEKIIILCHRIVIFNFCFQKNNIFKYQTLIFKKSEKLGESNIIKKFWEERKNSTFFLLDLKNFYSAKTFFFGKKFSWINFFS
ncbi:hypothetical protein A3B64_00465 [candidate division WWE3 bacterium RIFCSPLOWO2_01_FULL_37_24]|nr:MAG: hypothetical protein A3B64_00465 [candidate division WWE3 bacterium RIFCSPLOWO2_01_FULL_37_24]